MRGVVRAAVCVQGVSVCGGGVESRVFLEPISRDIGALLCVEPSADLPIEQGKTRLAASPARRDGGYAGRGTPAL